MECSTHELDPEAVQKAVQRLTKQRWPDREGHRHGVAWALHVASYEDIQWWLSAVSSGEDIVPRLEENRPGFAEDWADDIQGPGLEEGLFWLGFGAGVVEVWRRVAAEVEAQ